MTNEEQRQKVIEASKLLSGKTIVIETDADFTPEGKRIVKIVSSRRGKKLPRRMLAWYVGGRFYRNLELTTENCNLSEEWIEAQK